MAIEALIDDFKVLDVIDSPYICPSFGFDALARELPGILERRDSDRLKKLLNILAKVRTSWLFPYDTCIDFLLATSRLFHPILSIDNKVVVKIERKEKPGADTANGAKSGADTANGAKSAAKDVKSTHHERRVIHVHLSFDLLNDVFSLILSLISRVLRFEEDRLKEGCEAGTILQGDELGDEDSRAVWDDRLKQPDFHPLWGFCSAKDLSVRIVRELYLKVITAISTYSDPHPWTNEALNAAAKELEDVFLCLNQNVSLSEFIVGIPGEGDDDEEKENSPQEQGGGGGEAGKGGGGGGGKGNRKRKPSSLGLEALDLSDNGITGENNNDDVDDADATLCEETTIVVVPSEETNLIVKTTKRATDSNRNTSDSSRTTWPLDRKSHLPLFISHLWTYLRKDGFHSNLIKKHSFLWLVETVEAPRLSGAESLLFPMALLFLDSHEKEDKVMGLKCLTEIVQKIPPASILEMNHYSVISRSLIQQMLLNSVRIVHALHPCIIAFLETYHLATKDRKTKLLPELILSMDEVGGLRRSGPSAEDIENAETPRNQFFRQLLLQFEMGADLNFRRESLKYFGAHIRGMGIALCRYLKKTVSLLTDGLLIFSGDDTSDPEETTRLLCLDALCDVIRATKPRMHAHTPKIVSSVIKVMLDVTRPQNKKKDFARDNVMEKCKDVLILLGDAARKEVSKSLKVLPVSIIEEKVGKVIKAVLATLPDD